MRIGVVRLLLGILLGPVVSRQSGRSQCQLDRMFGVEDGAGFQHDCVNCLLDERHLGEPNPFVSLAESIVLTLDMQGIYWTVEHGRVRDRKFAVFRKREGFGRGAKGNVVSKSGPAPTATQTEPAVTPAVGEERATATTSTTPVAAETAPGTGRVQETV